MSNRIKVTFSQSENKLFGYLAAVLSGAEAKVPEQPLSDGCWEEILGLAQAHAVLPLLYPLVEQGYPMPESVRCRLEHESQRTVQQSYHLMFLTHYVVNGLEEAGISSVVLKGVAAAGAYPVPELRKSGDVDVLLLEPEQRERAEGILQGMGFARKPGENGNHHKVWRTDEGIDVELHVMMAEPFDSEKVNSFLREHMDHMRWRTQVNRVMGLDFPVLEKGDHAFQLLLHMLQHFLRAGFGLKLLCDWVVLWNGEVSQREREGYLMGIRQTGLSGFSDLITSLCIEYLGLDRGRAEGILTGTFQGSPEVFMREILDAEEFGFHEKSRMVVLRGNSFMDYIREFHHQMRLGYPSASRILLLWPVLWAMAFVKFCRNNRKIRGISFWQVIQRTRERSRYTKELHLFKNLEKHK
ncbi:MAG: nucleotidyltransferase family protein [Eubacterium sp.]|nr:nucleotidyltransferase family protein [Eubacterium sp.]